MVLVYLDYTHEGKGMAEIHTLELGPMENFIHLIVDRPSGEMAVVDPAWEVDEIIAYAASQQLKITTILLTHGHHDHINGVEALQRATAATVHLHCIEAEFFGLADRGWELFDLPFSCWLGESEIETVGTPGHTPGGVCYYSDGHLVTGDTLFVFGCGRCDLEGGDPVAMYRSLQQLQQRFGAETRIYPGHNYSVQPVSTLGEEQQGNPFLHCSSEAEFVSYRMELHDRQRSAPYGAVDSTSLRNSLMGA